MAYTVGIFYLKSGHFTYRQCAAFSKKPLPALPYTGYVVRQNVNGKYTRRKKAECEEE